MLGCLAWIVAGFLLATAEVVSTTVMILCTFSSLFCNSIYSSHQCLRLYIILYDLIFEKVNHFNSFFLCLFKHPTIKVKKLSDSQVFSASLYCNLGKRNGL